MGIIDLFKRLNDSELTSKGISLGKSGHCVEAIKCFVQALAISPKNTLAHYSLGLAYQSQGRIDDAVGEYNEALKINPNLSEARNNLGVIFHNQGRLDEAIQQYQKTLETNRNDAFVHYNLGLAYDYNYDEEDAEKEYWEAINNIERPLPDSSLAVVYSRLEYIYEHATEHHSHVLDSKKNTPLSLDGARVLLFTEIDPGVLGGKPIGFVRLAICQYEGDSGYYVFWCDRKWNVHNDDHWWSLEAAIEITERALRVQPTWRHPER